MALRAARQWRSMLTKNSQTRAFATTVHGHDIPTKSKIAMNADAVPIMMLGGFIVMVLTIGFHSGYRQLVYSPSVQVKKSKRETVPEVYDPDDVVGGADKFVNKSVLRKVGHIQEMKPMPGEPVRPDPFTKSRNVETLKQVGVRP